MKVFCVAAELRPHRPHTFLHDALHRAPPSCMECADSSFLYVDQQDRNAVGSLDGEQDSRQVGDQSISREINILGAPSFSSLFWTKGWDDTDVARMDLLRTDQPHP